VERAPDLRVVIEIPRKSADVRAWWTDLPQDYRASDPREQPHRIVTRSRDARRWAIDTYWRTPFARDLRVPEVFTFRPDGWDVEIALPWGLAQRDRFTLVETPDAGTRVEIEVRVFARRALGRLALPAYRAYARRSFPGLWRAAGKLCARDAPRLS